MVSYFLCGVLIGLLFGITGETKLLQGMCLVVGVFLGTYLWWGILSAAVNIMRNRKRGIISEQ